MHHFQRYAHYAAALGLLAVAAGVPVMAPRDQDADHMADAAGTFLQSLTPEQTAQAVFDFRDEERYNFHFIPRARKGISFKELDPAQDQLAHALLASGLSADGYRKSMLIISLEEVLRVLEQDTKGRRDAEKYYISIFGTPDSVAPWGWRVEGHHLSLNFTIVNGALISTTPHFFGANPQKIPSGPRAGFRTLAREEDLGRRLFQALTPQQQAQARFAETAPGDILTGHARDVMLEEPVGINASGFSQSQKALLQELIEEYAGNAASGMAEDRLAQMQQGLWDRTWFAWAGPDAVGAKHYYQVRGPEYLIEYDNTQNNGNHVHSVWRLLGGDFGQDLLRAHYRESH